MVKKFMPALFSKYSAIIINFIMVTKSLFSLANTGGLVYKELTIHHFIY